MQTIHGISDSLVPLRVHDKGGIAKSVQVVLTSSEEDKSALLVCTYDFLLNIFLFFFVSCTLAKSVLLILAAPAKLYKKNWYCYVSSKISVSICVPQSYFKTKKNDTFDVRITKYLGCWSTVDYQRQNQFYIITGLLVLCMQLNFWGFTRDSMCYEHDISFFEDAHANFSAP